MESPSDGNMKREPLLGSSSKGGFRTLPFIIVNEAFEKVASYGLLPNMVVYLMGGYGMELVTASNYIFYWSAATNLAPVIGAFLADSYVGRFWMIGFGSIISFLGILAFWLTTMIPSGKPCDESGSKCTSTNIFQLALLISSLGLMSIGAGGIRSASLAFGANQLDNKDNNLGNNTAIIEKYINWYYFAATAAAVVATTIAVYIQDNFGLRVGFGLLVVLMFLSALSFFLASPFYIKPKAKAGSLIGFAQVLEASWKKRDLILSSDKTHQLYHFRKGSRPTIPSDKLRFLNKACIVRDAREEVAPDGTAVDPWTLCTTDQVEGIRREIAIREGLSDDPNIVVPMSALWLLPHHFISGMAEAFMAVGQNEFFYMEFPRSMSSVATNLYGVGMSVANVIASLIMTSIDTFTSKGGKESWVSSNINKAHFDYYYWILACLCFVNFFYYLICSRAYGPSNDQEGVLGDEELRDE